jgi:hypothetical protein
VETALDYLNEFDIQPGPKGVLEIANKGRGDLAVWLAKFCKIGAEIGVARGEYSECLMNANPTMKLYGVDPHTTYGGYKDYALNSTMHKLRDEAHARLDRFPGYEFVEKFSMDAVKDFEDESLDFVYIDANHDGPHVTEDVTEWAKKVRKGGVVSGHDYGRVRSLTDRYDVVNSVNRYAAENGIQLYIWGLNGKLPHTIRDNIRSWMFIKS